MRHTTLGIVVCSALLAVACSSIASATVSVPIGNYTVAPGQSITIAIPVSSNRPVAADRIEGMTFTLQVEGGVGSTPAIASLDLITGTIWSGHVAAPITPAGGDGPQFKSRLLVVDTPGDYIDANGRLATVSFSTVGAIPNTHYALRLIGTIDPGNDSAFFDDAGDPVTAFFGTGDLLVTNAPEPADALAGLAGIALRRRRR